MFKINIDTIASPINILNQLQPKTYFLNTANIYGFPFSNQRQYGFIAQEVEQVLPELVSISQKPEKRDTLGNIVYPAVSYKSLNYNALFGIIVAAMQKQQQDIETKDSLINDLNKRLTSIETCIEGLNLCDDPISGGKKSMSSAYSEVHLKDDVQSIVLDQNIPNPFAEHTVIGYFLPEDVQSAEIIFHNAEGKKINNVAITERGKGELSVYADDLSNGIYTYTLITDGKVADTKRMVKR